MTTSKEFELKDFAKPLHDYTDETLQQWAKEAAEILNAKQDGCTYKTSFCTSERGSRAFIYVQQKEENGAIHEASIVPGEMGKEFAGGEDIAEALQTELANRERSRAYVRGEVDRKEFEDKYAPEEISEDEPDLDR